MIKYTSTQVVFQEFPDEVALAINLSLCPNRCKGCHSEYLREDIGQELTIQELDKLIKENDDITCIGFMGGDNDTKTLLRLIEHVKETTSLKTGWYSGKDEVDDSIFTSNKCDYIKIGHYDEDFGPINKETTNQRMLFLSDTGYEDITELFWKNK